MNTFIDDFVLFLKPCTPYIMAGLVGSVVHRMRNKMTVVDFFKFTFTSMFVSVIVGIGCREYLGVTNIHILFGLCGISGAFSKDILAEIKPIIKAVSEFIQSKFKSKNETI